MAPQHPTDQSAHLSASPSSSSEVITSSLFGLCALVIGIITIWQGKKLRATWTRAFGDHGLQCEGIAVAGILNKAYDANSSLAGSAMAYELDDTRIESSIGTGLRLQAFAAPIDDNNEMYAPPSDSSVELFPRRTGVQSNGEVDVITPLSTEACASTLAVDGPTASACRDGQLTFTSSLFPSGARPVPPGFQMFETIVAM